MKLKKIKTFRKFFQRFNSHYISYKVVIPYMAICFIFKKQINNSPALGLLISFYATSAALLALTWCCLYLLEEDRISTKRQNQSLKN